MQAFLIFQCIYSTQGVYRGVWQWEALPQQSLHYFCNCFSASFLQSPLCGEMGRAPCCSGEHAGLKKGPWTHEEDHKLRTFLLNNRNTSWRQVPPKAGSCLLKYIFLFIYFLSQRSSQNGYVMGGNI